MQHFLAQALTDEEKQYLFDQRNSEQFRIFSKAITYLYSLKAAELANTTPELLLRYQGILQGLLISKNLLVLGKFPDK
jgi:hypothetical protein